MTTNNEDSSLDIQEGGNHYKDLEIQPVEYCQRDNLKFCESNAIKYLTRHQSKGKELDLRKAMHYTQMALWFEYGVKCEVTYEGD